jgi:chemotaxis protein CheD
MSVAVPLEPMQEAPREIYLVPGAFYCTVEPSLITTVLGSCVGVCLWDPVRRAGGMNHYVLPLSPEDDRTPRYGDIAIDRLVEAMARLGCRLQDVIAKLFGGANVLPYGVGYDTVGEKNVRLALDRLDHHRIVITARRTGGESGLLVKFHTESGIAMVRPIGP